MYEEVQYLNLIKNITENGILKKNRTGVDTRSVFGNTMRFTLSNNTIPLLTTKKVFWKGVVEELLFFITGKTNAKILSNKGVNIWNGNSSREYLDKLGFTTREEGDLGPVYGFQWRYFGAEYKSCTDDYTSQGYDQLCSVITDIIKNPFSRRHVVSSWNPLQLSEMVLPPCHVLFQFNVDPDEEDIDKPKYLSCSVYQRSADIIGIPFNIASYSLLTHIIAVITGLTAKELVYTTGDTHIYVNNIDPCLVQITREPLTFPKVNINPRLNFSSNEHTISEILNNLISKDIELIDYNYHPPIKMSMVV